MVSAGGNTELISIIVPIYNVERYLEKCICSILKQSYSSFEVLLVDDGSTDSSLEICEKWAAEDNRIRILKKSNGGLSDARNFGLRYASGKYITFVDSDDWIEEDYLEFLHASIVRDDSDISTCIYYSCTENGRTPWKGITSDSTEVMDRDSALLSLLYSSRIDVSATCKLYKAKLFEGVSFPVGMHFEDVGTTYKLILKAQKTSVGMRPLYNYLMRPGSIVHQSNNKIFDRSALAAKAYEELSRDPNPVIRRAALRYYAFNCLSVLRMINLSDKAQCEEAGRIRKAVLSYKNEILKDPSLPNRDRIAIKSLQLGLPFYHFAWHIYVALREH